MTKRSLELRAQTLKPDNVGLNLIPATCYCILSLVFGCSLVRSFVCFLRGEFCLREESRGGCQGVREVFGEKVDAWDPAFCSWPQTCSNTQAIWTRQSPQIRSEMSPHVLDSRGLVPVLRAPTLSPSPSFLCCNQLRKLLLAGVTPEPKVIACGLSASESWKPYCAYYQAAVFIIFAIPKSFPKT